MRVALFITCLSDQFLPRAGIAATLVLESLGCTVEFPESQTCCGQPMFNNGAHDQARGLARRFASVFGSYEHIVTPSGSCASMVRKHFAELCPDEAGVLATASRVREFCEFLAGTLGLSATDIRSRARRDTAQRLGIHTSCHQRTLGLIGQAQALLSGVPGLSVLPLEHDEQCCGFGGTFAVKQPELSAAMVSDKVTALKAARPDALVSGDAGCLLNIAGACRRAGVRLRPLSAAEVIAEAWGLLDPEPTS